MAVFDGSKEVDLLFHRDHCAALQRRLANELVIEQDLLSVGTSVVSQKALKRAKELARARIRARSWKAMRFASSFEKDVLDDDGLAEPDSERDAEHVV